MGNKCECVASDKNLEVDLTALKANDPYYKSQFESSLRVEEFQTTSASDTQHTLPEEPSNFFGDFFGLAPLDRVHPSSDGPQGEALRLAAVRLQVASPLALHTLNSLRGFAGLQDLRGSEMVWSLARTFFKKQNRTLEDPKPEIRKIVVQEFLEDFAARKSASRAPRAQGPSGSKRREGSLGSGSLSQGGSGWRQPALGGGLEFLRSEGDEIYYGATQGGKREGFGRQLWPDQSVYEGYWSEDSLEGFGVMVFSDGDSYCGEWRENKMHGFGVFCSRGRFQYVGEFSMNEPFGFGEELWENGLLYLGQFALAAKSGRGFMQAGWGSFEGNFLDSRAEGFGKIYREGISFEGPFASGKANGDFLCTTSTPSGSFKLKISGSAREGVVNPQLLVEFKGKVVPCTLRNGSISEDSSNRSVLSEISDVLARVGKGLRHLPVVAFDS